MAIQLRQICRFVAYLTVNNKLLALVIVYEVLALAAYLLSGYDLLIPCLYKVFLHTECPGCGLTSAFIEILSLDFLGAFHTNPLIFLVLILGTYIFIKAYQRFLLTQPFST